MLARSQPTYCTNWGGALGLTRPRRPIGNASFGQEPEPAQAAGAYGKNAVRCDARCRYTYELGILFLSRCRITKASCSCRHRDWHCSRMRSRSTPPEPRISCTIDESNNVYARHEYCTLYRGRISSRLYPTRAIRGHSPLADLHSDVAAKARAKVVYDTHQVLP